MRSLEKKAETDEMFDKKVNTKTTVILPEPEP
jgi:hypothetical protein